MISRHIKPLISYIKSLPDEHARLTFALRVGVSSGYLQLVMRGSRKPSAELALKISEATNWSVTPHQLRPSAFRYPKDGIPEQVLNETNSNLQKNATAA